MHFEVQERELGSVPIGAILMTPLFGLPLGAYLVETGTIDFGVCGMKKMLGIPCLSCGSTRATVHLLHGDVLGALTLQPMMMFVYTMLFAWGAVSLWGFLRRKKVVMRLTKVEDITAKLSLIVLPLINWAYLIWAGV